MATGAGNTFDIILHDGKTMYIPDLTGTLPIYQGQIACWDATLNGGNGGIRAALTQADMAKYVGIAEQNSILNSLNEQLPTVRVGFKNVYRMNSTSAEVYKMGDPLYFNEAITGSLTVTSGTNAGARTKVVGYHILSNSTMLGGITTVTGSAGQEVLVAVVANWPIVGLA